jgi:hypothetical protein
VEGREFAIHFSSAGRFRAALVDGSRTVGSIKNIVAGVLAVAGLAGAAFAVSAAPAAALPVARAVPVVGLRPLPTASPTPPAATAPVRAEPAPVAPAVPPVPADEDPAPIVKLPPHDAGAHAPVVAAAPGTETPPAAAPPPAPAAAKPAAARPEAAARPAPAPTTPSGDGLLNLEASDTADVFLDGKKVGASPVRGLKVKAGPHRVRFDCYDEAGNAVMGTVKPVAVTADGVQDVTWTCPAAQEAQ